VFSVDYSTLIIVAELPHSSSSPTAARLLLGKLDYWPHARRQGMTQAIREDPQMLKTLALAFTTLLIDRFDWFVMGVMLTFAALLVCLYW
jgi:hypothetical protein